MARVTPMRRLLLPVLIVVLVSAGCGGDDEEGTATDATTAPAAATGATGAELEQAEPPLEKQDGESGPSTGDSVPAGGSPKEVLELFFTSGDPELACGELATENLLSSAYGDEKGCRQAQVPAATPDSIEIESVDVSGAEATATVIPDGGPNDGIETKVALVKNGEVWLVDSLEADVPAGP
jgi:hypothetical protein